MRKQIPNNVRNKSNILQNQSLPLPAKTLDLNVSLEETGKVISILST